MLVWLAEHLVKYYSGFNVFFISDVSRHRQPADRAVHLVVDGPAHDRPSAKLAFGGSYVTTARSLISVNAVLRPWAGS